MQLERQLKPLSSPNTAVQWSRAPNTKEAGRIEWKRAKTDGKNNDESLIRENGLRFSLSVCFVPIAHHISFYVSVCCALLFWFIESFFFAVYYFSVWSAYFMFSCYGFWFDCKQILFIASHLCRTLGKWQQQQPKIPNWFWCKQTFHSECAFKYVPAKS